MKNTFLSAIPITWKAFYALFIIAFVPGIFHIFFRSRTNLNSILLTFITAVLVMPLLIRAWRYTQGLKLSEKAVRWIMVAFISVSSILQLYIGNRLRFTPMWDPEAIFDGARMWALTGSLDHHTIFHGTYLQYFAMFSNQWGSTFLFRWLFWIYNLFGGTDFHIPALVWNVALVQVMVFSLYAAAKRLKGPGAGLFVLFLLGVFLPFHFFGAVYYTDTLSMPFTAIAFSLYLRAKDELDLRKKLITFGLCGLAVAIGATIKFTVVIILVAIVIDYLLAKEQGFVHRLLCSIAAVSVAVIVIGSFNMYMNRVIGPEMIDRHRVPRAHWVMMGLNHYGFYNPQDYDFTMGIPDFETRQSEVTRVARERLRERGVGGMARLYLAKFAINMGDGTYEMYRILHQNPVNQTRLHDITLSGGRNYNAYVHIATGFTTAFLLLMLAGAIHGFRKLSHTAVPWLSLFGLVMILTVWESGARLAMNFFPMLVMGAIIGLSCVEPLARWFMGKEPKHEVKTDRKKGKK
ncbi:MAG: glycosyltransferase family 39 protein [Defluviitaleaceae bacterium]|nr:glycosyltransferase family 39 protein [Defluviitaleaceae bacterium]